MTGRRIAKRTCLALAIGALAPAGCSMVNQAGGPTLGTVGYLYQGGQATQGFPFPAEKVQEAVQDAMADLGIHQVQQTVDGAGLLRLDGQTVDGRRATVKITRANTLPVVTARVGWLGDEPLSRALMDRVGIRLGSLPAEAIPAEPPSTPGGPSLQSFFSRKELAPGTPLPVQGDVGYNDSPIP